MIDFAMRLKFVAIAPERAPGSWMGRSRGVAVFASGFDGR